MRRIAVTVLLLGCSLAVESHGQGTFQVTFDGPPLIPPGTGGIATNYEEAGMSFTAIPSPPPGLATFSRWGAATDPRDPDNGTAFLRAALTQSLMFRFINGSLFNLVSVDLGEYSTVVPDPVTVQFVGYYLDGSTVTTSFTTDGIIDGTGPQADFQTFLFPDKEWSRLQRVEIPTYGWSLDNLVVSVPEPTTLSLALGGVALLGLKRRWRRRCVSGNRSVSAYRSALAWPWRPIRRFTS